MLQQYGKVNDRVRKWLWILVVLGLIASTPLVYKRVQTERSTKNVEIVFDYRDLLEASAYRPNPESYVQEWLKTMKENGIGSMAVYESSLEELKNSRRIQVFTPQEYSLLTGKPPVPGENYTYLLFTSTEARDKLQPVIERTYRDRLKVTVSTWTHNNRTGLVIGLPYEEANTKPMEPDPMTMDMLQKEGFRIVARLSNRVQPYTEAELDDWLNKLSDRGVKRIVFDGNAVTGFDESPKPNNAPKMAALLKKYNMGTATIERLKAQQKGFTASFADKLDYNVVRLFPLFDTEVNLKPDQIADKLVLAVKDRNMRMLFLNTKAAKDLDKGYMNDYLDNIMNSLTGPDGAIPRIEKAGYQLGEAHAFVVYGESLQPLKLAVLVAGAALIALTIGLFFPALVTAAFVIGTIGVLGLYVLSSSVGLQAMAFGAGVCAPTLSTILAIRYIRSRSGVAAGSNPHWGRALLVFAATSVLTLVGVVYVVALLSHINYYLVLEQFRGVALLHLLPMAFVGVYALLFAESNRLSDVVARLRTILLAKITVLWIVLAAVFGAAVYYYLTRTGNEGQASELEKVWRAFLENGLGVRPRNKEFLFAHPLFILAAYMFMKYRNAIYLFAGAVMGQLSMVDTFAHLHTPLHISFIRVGYGIVFGIVISLVYVAVWELLARGWRRWAPK
ncbi:DUF5693 family protein [Paenibacillus flagellatus]|uniref:Uncharacterized protein n=1 Tax=Paenibacillus flagellatus TaxID=2211139 RepID=A0A2V5JWJ6_9BACL|nr:DUF5693 family protein [Paenibacillus flagellatus]PYI51159.1 hypothetical protein DLM86_26075 [Paenibacillus flagellatus]